MKPSPPNRPDAELALKRDADADALRRREERVLLRDQLAAELGEVDRDDLSRVRRAERDLALLAAAIQEHGHEQRFAGQQPFAGAHQRAEEPALLLRSVAEDRLHLDAVVHVHHAAGFGDGGFVRIQLDFDELHVVAKNLVIDLVHRRHEGSCASHCQLALSEVEGPGPANLPAAESVKALVTQNVWVI